LASPGLDELPHRSQKKAVDFVDNSLAKGRQRTGALAVDKSQNRDLSTARPFAHKLHSLIMIFYIPQKQNIQGSGRGALPGSMPGHGGNRVSQRIVLVMRPGIGPGAARRAGAGGLDEGCVGPT
jgi:hypothetical protein